MRLAEGHLSLSDLGVEFLQGGPAGAWACRGEPRAYLAPPSLSQTPGYPANFDVMTCGTTPATKDPVVVYNDFPGNSIVIEVGSARTTISMEEEDLPDRAANMQWPTPPTDWAGDPIDLSDVLLQCQGARVADGLVILWGRGWTYAGAGDRSLVASWSLNRFWVAYATMADLDSWRVEVSPATSEVAYTAGEAGAITQVWSGDVHDRIGEGPSTECWFTITNYRVDSTGKPDSGENVFAVARFTRTSADATDWSSPGLVNLVRETDDGTHYHNGIAYAYGEDGICCDLFIGDNPSNNQVIRRRRGDLDIYTDATAWTDASPNWFEAGPSWQSPATVHGGRLEDVGDLRLGCQSVGAIIQRDERGEPWVYVGPDEQTDGLVRYRPAMPGDGDRMRITRVPGSRVGYCGAFARHDQDDVEPDCNGFVWHRGRYDDWDSRAVIFTRPGNSGGAYAAEASRLVILERGRLHYGAHVNEDTTQRAWPIDHLNNVYPTGETGDDVLTRYTWGKAVHVSPVVVSPGGTTISMASLAVNTATAPRTIEVASLDPVQPPTLLPHTEGWLLRSNDTPTAAFCGMPRIGTSGDALDLDDLDADENRVRAQFMLGVYGIDATYGAQLEVEFEARNAAEPDLGGDGPARGPRVRPVNINVAGEWIIYGGDLDLTGFIGTGATSSFDPEIRLLAAQDGTDFGRLDAYMAAMVVNPATDAPVIRPMGSGQTIPHDIARTVFDGSGTGWSLGCAVMVPQYGWDSTSAVFLGPKHLITLREDDTSYITVRVDAQTQEITLAAADAGAEVTATGDLAAQVHRCDPIVLELSRSGSTVTLSYVHLQNAGTLVIDLGDRDPRPTEVRWGGDAAGVTTGIEILATTLPALPSSSGLLIPIRGL